MNERLAEERALLLQNPYIINEKSPTPYPPPPCKDYPPIFTRKS